MAYNGPFAGGGITAVSGLPTFTAADAGKTLTIDPGGTVVAQTSAATPIASLPVLVNEDGAQDQLRVLRSADGLEYRILIDNVMSSGTL